MSNKKDEAKTPEKKESKELAVQQPSQGERFTNAVMKEFAANAGELEISSFQRRLIKNYFIKIDNALKDAEKKRLLKGEKYRDPLEFKWDNVNMQKLAVDVVAFSCVGLDPAQANHINTIPYKNSTTNKFDIGFIPGYKGIEVKAKKYGLDVPDDVVVEVVYSTDKFKQIKKDLNNKIDSYTFEVINDFDRGEIIGGFYYHVYFGQPQKNKIRVFTMDDINKRKPDYASVEFWGGEKDKWENGQKVGKEKVEGWLYEMVYKTIYRAAYNAVTIDGEKIDDHFQLMIQRDRELLDEKVATEIKANANKETLQIPDEQTPEYEVTNTPVESQQNKSEGKEEKASNRSKAEAAQAEMGF